MSSAGWVLRNALAGSCSKVSCLDPVYPAHPLSLGTLRRCRRDAKGSPACRHWIHSASGSWQCCRGGSARKPPSLPPSCCPSHPGSPEDAAVAAEGWLGGDRRLGGWRDVQGHWEGNEAASPHWLGQGRAWLGLQQGVAVQFFLVPWKLPSGGKKNEKERKRGGKKRKTTQVFWMQN